MTFTVRVPEPEDAADIADLHVIAWQETYTNLLPEDYFDAAWVEDRHRMWARLLESPRDRRMRIAEEDGRIIGLALSAASTPQGEEQPPRERQLYMLYVLAAAHGRGVGQALLDEVLGDEPAVLWVAKENPRAIAFYRRNGFEFDGPEQTYPGAPTLVDARMVR